MANFEKRAAALCVKILRNNLTQLLLAIEGIEDPGGPLETMPEIGDLFVHLMMENQIFSPTLETVMESVIPESHPLKAEHQRLSARLTELIGENIKDVESLLENIREAQEGIIVTMEGGGEA